MPIYLLLDTMSQCIFHFLYFFFIFKVKSETNYLNSNLYLESQLGFTITVTSNMVIQPAVCSIN